MKKILSIVSGIRNPFSRLGKNAKTDWHFALLCALTGIIVALIIDAILFVSLSAEDTSEASTENLSSIGINKDDISGTIEGIEKRNEAALTIPESVTSDPSI
jgi:hypothetical protein